MGIGRVFLNLSMSDISKMTKKEIIDYLRKMDIKAARTASTDDIETHFINAGIETICPECQSKEKYSNDVKIVKVKVSYLIEVMD